MVNKQTYDRALVRLEALCARSEQCTYDLKQKLYRWGVSSDDASQIIKDLEMRRYVDDCRFACAYVRDKYRFSRWGRNKITLGLRAKNIEENVIDEALDVINQDEFMAGMKALLLMKLRGTTVPLGYDERMRLYRFMSQRGFESSLISFVLKQIESSCNEDGNF